MGNTTDLSPQVAATRGTLLSATDGFLTATNTLTSAANAFASVSGQMEQRFKELEEREVNLKALEEVISCRSLELDQRESQCKERERKIAQLEQEAVERIAQREKDSEENLKEWTEIEKRMALNLAKLPTLVHMNIGGRRFTAPKETLLQFKGSYFESMLKTDHPQQDSGGEFFIDRDYRIFEYLFDFIRTGKMKPISLEDQLALENEFTFFKIPFPIHAGNLVSEYLPLFSLWIPNKHFVLLYKASRDGFKGDDFHKICDNKGPTLTIIQSKDGFLFGGYSSGPWDHSDTWKSYPNSFIFTLTNPHSIPPTKYPPKPGETQITFCSLHHGPIFGSGHDIYVSSENHQNNSSHTCFPTSFQDTTGKGNKTFTGSLNFSSKEVEVYAVI